jgi:hypothetical protein
LQAPIVKACHGQTFVLHDAHAGEWNAGGTGPIARILPFSLITAIAGRWILDETSPAPADDMTRENYRSGVSHGVVQIQKDERWT